MIKRQAIIHITITTDFGLADGYQAVLEGVIAGINRRAVITAITHNIAPGDIAGGWYLLKTHYKYFPPGTVHLAIIDPGVGGRRKIIAVRTSRYFFVAPDNGLLSFIPKKDIVSIHSITNRDYALSSVSPVFHGRDIMAPAAGYLSLGVDPSCFGRKCGKMKGFAPVMPKVTRRGIIGRVIRIDRFGNLVSNIEATSSMPRRRVVVNGIEIGPVCKTFGDVGPGKPLAYIGSGGHLEIAIRNGSAWNFFSDSGGGYIEILVAGK